MGSWMVDVLERRRGMRKLTKTLMVRGIVVPSIYHVLSAGHTMLVSYPIDSVSRTLSNSEALVRPVSRERGAPS